MNRPSLSAVDIYHRQAKVFGRAEQFQGYSEFNGVAIWGRGHKTLDAILCHALDGITPVIVHGVSRGNTWLGHGDHQLTDFARLASEGNADVI